MRTNTSGLDWVTPLTEFPVVQPLHFPPSVGDKWLLSVLSSTPFFPEVLNQNKSFSLKKLHAGRISKGSLLHYVKRKQVSSFLPNLIHSLDAAHMMLTATAMKSAGKRFVSVHDSYWTHPSDISDLNKVWFESTLLHVTCKLLRDAFVKLHSSFSLEEFALKFNYPPGAKFPKLPSVGKLDLNLIRNSTYLFH